MEIKQKQKLDRHIRQKIKSLKQDVESFKRLTEPVSPDNAIGRITRMEAINSKSINEAALSKAKYTLSKLEEALPKINDPDFGLCTECEEPIPFARLMVMPETGFCVKCAERMGG